MVVAQLATILQLQAVQDKRLEGTTEAKGDNRVAADLMLGRNAFNNHGIQTYVQCPFEFKAPQKILQKRARTHPCFQLSKAGLNSESCPRAVFYC